MSDGRAQMKRANSLEEVSKTKLEDLADPTESSRSVGEGRTSQVSLLTHIPFIKIDIIYC
jgi:hypothetical protein